MAPNILVGLVFLAVFQEVGAYNCTKCDKSKCLPESTPCPGNWAIDPCQCCRHCARQNLDICGGNNWEFGYCDHRTRCAAFNGTDLVQIPDIGVCKWLPNYPYMVEDDEMCPLQYGCYIRTGVCDCYTKNTCLDDFRYYDRDVCYRNTDAGYFADPDYVSNIEICWNEGCEIKDRRCLCEFGKCRTTYTYKNKKECAKALVHLICGNITCPALPKLNCSSDSVPSNPYTPPGECCPTIGSFCTCNFDTCKTGCWERNARKKKMISKGTGVPGNCCDQFECVPGLEDQ
ncbi:cysteine-rich motor neuron 1 protein-like [Ambystoma mexicanum]|uniref:cysteine-rich motor neuron 1 protein-like n=1 Tax=Ambystoma mexicanum TaxID=8296 RepID=UPI0037E7F844